jgi:hypothetical protein
MAQLEGVKLEEKKEILLSNVHYFFQSCCSFAGIDLRSKKQIKEAAKIFLNFLDEYNIKIRFSSRVHFENLAGAGRKNPYKKYSADAKAAEAFHNFRCD